LLDVLAYLPTSGLGREPAELRPEDADAVAAQLRLLHDVRLGRAARGAGGDRRDRTSRLRSHLVWREPEPGDADDAVPGDPVNEPIYLMRVDEQGQLVQHTTEITNRFPGPRHRVS
jgi:hypothetical protein